MSHAKNHTTTITLHKDPAGLKIRILFTIMSFTVVWIVGWWLIRIPFRIVGSELQTRTLLMIALYVVLVFAINMIMQKSWSKTYYLKGKSLIVAKNSTFLNRVGEQIYRLDTIVAVHTRQGIFGKKHNYGDIILAIPRHSATTHIILKDIKNPQEAIEHIHQILASSGTSGFSVS